MLAYSLFERAAGAEPSLQDVLCDGRDECRLSKSLGGITADDGTRREVWRLTLPEEGESRADDPNCTFEEFWLVARDRASAVVDHRLFGGGCARSSPKTAWCGDPPRIDVKVSGRVLSADGSRHALRCMSVYHSPGSFAASLDDFRPSRTSSRSFRVFGPEEGSISSWDFTRQRGSTRFVGSGGSCPAIRRGPIPSLPAFELPEVFVDDAWRTSDMSRCATRIDRGYGFAPKGGAANVALLLLATGDGTLFIDVEPAAGKRALTNDAVVRVCHSLAALYTSEYCHETEEVHCTKFTLDGRVLEGELRVEASKESLGSKSNCRTTRKASPYRTASRRAVAGSRRVKSGRSTTLG